MPTYRDMEFGSSRTPNLTKALDWAGYLFLGVLGLWATPSSIYTLDQQRGQQAVIQRFGAYTRTETHAGIHLKWPWPIESATVVSTSEVRRLEVGFQTRADRPGDVQDQSEHSISLTKDQNLVNAEFTVQFVIADPKAYLFHVEDPEGTLAQLAKAAMRGVVANRGVDEVLVGDRMAMQGEVHQSIQSGLDAYGAGIKVTAVQLQSPHAPKAVEHAFSDVQRAKEDKETAMSDGRRAYNAKVPVAEGQAERVLATAEAYKTQRVNEAKGDAKRFLSLLEEYKKDPEFTRRQLYLQAMMEVLPRVDKWVVDKDIPLSLWSSGEAPKPPPGVPENR